MAGGRAVGRFEVAIGVIGLLALGTTLMIITGWSPLPAIQGWLNRVVSVSSPAPTWSHRLGGRPESATVTVTGEVIVTMRGRVEAYHVVTGAPLWGRDVDWAVTAGDVVVTGVDGHGYAVVNPTTGTLLWTEEQATGVWAYDNVIVDWICPSDDSCTIRGRSHGQGGRVLWHATVPGNGRSLSHGNPDVLDTRDPAGWFDPAASADLGLAPGTLGLPVDRRVQLVDLTEGRRVREINPPDGQTRVSVVAGRVLYSRAERVGSSCRFTLEAFDGETGTSLWRRDGYDLGTASGAGCEQRRDPLGAGGVLVAVRGDNRPVVLDADQGTEDWVGQPGEKVLATDGRLAALREPDQVSVRVIDLVDRGRVVFTQQVGTKPLAAITPDWLLLYGQQDRHLTVLSRGGVPLTILKTDASVIGYGTASLVLASGRTIGLVTVG
jgi:outer membrane protein assembly factor BamB